MQLLLETSVKPQWWFDVFPLTPTSFSGKPQHISFVFYQKFISPICKTKRRFSLPLSISLSPCPLLFVTPHPEVPAGQSTHGGDDVEAQKVRHEIKMKHFSEMTERDFRVERWFRLRGAFCVCVRVHAESLFDLLSIFQINLCEMVRTNGLQEAQEWRSADA